MAFTGTLAAMTHAQAGEVVRQHGGEATDHVSRQTTMLVVGEEGWPLDDDGQVSVKLREVEEWNQSGGSTRIVEEADFLHLVGLSETRDEVRRLYTPAMLSNLLDMPVPRHSWLGAGGSDSSGQEGLSAAVLRLPRGQLRPAALAVAGGGRATAGD